MKANEANLMELLRKSRQFAIPIFQRTYSWTERECRQLWDDINRTGSSDAIRAHFVGSIVYIEESPYVISNQSPLLVIDGQQRLTTVSLLIAALAKALAGVAEKEQEPLQGFSPRKLRNYYLVNPEEEGEKRHKLILTQTDKASLIAVVNDNPQPTVASLRITQNYALFESWIAAPECNVATVCKGLAKLMVVDVALSRGQDNPQLIFESMNSTGRELTQADLIRNFVLMGLEPSQQIALYEQYWRPMEVDFGQEAYGRHFDKFMRHYLTFRTGEIPNIRAVYEAFKTYARSPQVAQAGVAALVADLRIFAGHYCRMALGAEPDLELEAAFHDLRELRVDVAFPFLLEMYHDYHSGLLTREDLLAAVRFVEAYVFRRAICAIPTNSLNKTFSTFTRVLKKDRYLESVQVHFLTMPSYRRFPSDQEFHRDLKTRDLYNFPRRSYWLRRLENYGRKERVCVDEYTIEHILPQNENLSAAWRTALGPEWERIHATWLHTLGNLTLTGYNSEYGDRSFPEKRDMKGGFRESPLRVNAGLGQLAEWNEETIKARAEKLAGTAVHVWATPSLKPEVLEAYRPKGVAADHVAKHHPHVLTSPTRELFTAFRREVLALDPCVTEVSFKSYIAYKAETNFVDVVPQSSRLRLSLNLSFPEIYDPRDVCRDVTGLGHWGNGDVELVLASLHELPYVMGLVRQALEKQLGNGENG